MTYTKQTWTDGQTGNTPVSAARLTVIENGIAAAHDGIVNRMTAAQRASLTTSGLLSGYFVYETDTFRNYEWTGTAWQYIGGGTVPTAGVPFNTNARNYLQTNTSVPPTFDPSEYYKDANGIVHFIGFAECTVAVNTGTVVTIGTMPAGFRPAIQNLNWVYFYAGSPQFGRVDVLIDGSMKLTNNTGVNWAAGGWFPINTISYKAGN
jgi:hypothetical protein